MEVVVPLLGTVAVGGRVQIVQGQLAKLDAAETRVIHSLDLFLQRFIGVAAFRHPPAHFRAFLNVGRRITCA